MKVQALAPTRISLFGGGTDVDPYAFTYGGLVINLAINLRTRFTLFTGDDVYDPRANSEIPYLGKKEFVHAFLEEFELGDMHRARFSSQTEAILESGLGSSASSAVAIIGVVNKLKNLKMNLDQIAEKAWEIEVKKLGLFGGKQDQYAAAYGGVNVMVFNKGRVMVTPLARGFIEPLLPSLLLFYTGKNRKSGKIQEGFKNLSQDQIDVLNRIKKIALKTIEPIGQGDFIKVGALLDEAWEWKKLSNKGVSNKEIDAIYQKAKNLGAYGGKVLGAGGGGFMLFVVNPDEREKFIKKLGLEWFDFGIDWNGLETRILND